MTDSVEISLNYSGNEKTESNVSRLPKKLFVIAAFIFAVLGTITISSSGFYKSFNSSLEGKFTMFQAKLRGPQPIKKNCANLYGGDPIQFPETEVIVVCNNKNLLYNQLSKFQLGHNSVSHGISYVETGANIWVTLFEENHYKGNTYVIPPKQTIWLEDTPLGTSQTIKWNDKTMSLSTITISGSKGAKASVMYAVSGLQDVPSPYCAILYGSNPLKSPSTLGLVACGVPSLGKVWSFTQDTIESFHLKSLKSYSTGTSYVKLGDLTTITLYDGSDLAKDSFNKITLGPGKNYDLTQFKLPDQTATWNDRPLSFVLTY
jgi:hypothetical protein